jgi:biopolymer transport protein ExbD
MTATTSSHPNFEPNVTPMLDVMHAMDVAKSAGVTVVGLAPKDVYLKR